MNTYEALLAKANSRFREAIKEVISSTDLEKGNFTKFSELMKINKSYLSRFVNKTHSFGLKALLPKVKLFCKHYPQFTEASILGDLSSMTDADIMEIKRLSGYKTSQTDAGSLFIAQEPLVEYGGVSKLHAKIGELQVKNDELNDTVRTLYKLLISSKQREERMLEIIENHGLSTDEFTDIS